MALDNAHEITPVRFTLNIRGGLLAGWRWLNAEKPPLLFCHATGFCASAYKQMLQQLSGVFDVYAVDMRGHGNTRLPANPYNLRSWAVYAADVAALLDAEGRQEWTLAGHSMGAVVAVMAAKGRGDVSALRLIEPVVMPRALAALAHMPVWGFFASRMPIVRKAAGRRAAWNDRAAVAASYERKALFRNWASGVLADYLEDGLGAGGGGVKLACDPAWEAATFAAQANDFWGAVRAAAAETSVLAAGDATSTTPPRARRGFLARGVGITVVAGGSHLIPMETPEIAAKFIAEAAK